MEFLKKIGTKIKVAFGVVIGLLGFVVFFFIREKIRARDKMNYELTKLESELKIAELEVDSEEKITKITELKEKESVIREKIKVLKEMEIDRGRDISLKELDAFFDSRGF